MYAKDIRNIILASTSSIKLDAVAEFFEIPREKILCKNMDNCVIPTQPYGSGWGFCNIRQNHVLKNLTDFERENYDHLITIENAINSNITDICWMQIYNIKQEKIVKYTSSLPIKFNEKYYNQVKKLTRYHYNNGEGFSITVGEVIKMSHPEVNDKDWMADPRFNLSRSDRMVDNRLNCINGYSCRKDQIIHTFQLAFPADTMRKELIPHVTIIPDFPKPGVLFKDLSPILANGNLFQKLIKLCIEKLDHEKCDFEKVIGLDARGFIYGTALATKMTKGFGMVRKMGKLPFSNENEKISVDYITEYSTDTFEILKTSITPGEKVLLVDDLIATGGTLKAARQLVEQAGGKVVGILVILKVDFLYEKALDYIGRDVPVIVVL
jgi:adenine phosphoribosyltransferase